MRNHLALVACAALFMTSSLGTGAARELEVHPALDFSLRLYQDLDASGGGNLVFSPLSAYLALAMAAEGADSYTLAEIVTVLGVPAERIATIAQALLSRMTDEGTGVRIAGSLWADPLLAVDERYRRKMADKYGAEVFTAELSLKETASQVNAWVSRKTEGRIPSILDAALPRDAALLLLNTVHFKANWADEFSGDSTRSRTFYLENGEGLETDFLSSVMSLRDHIQAEEAEGILLPYEGGETAFFALRPTNSKDVGAFVRGLTAAGLSAFVDTAAETLMNFAMPKFSKSQALSLTETMKTAGIHQAFDRGTADFSRMGSMQGAPLFITDMLQRVLIEVNEKGTEAAAATMNMMVASSMKLEKKPVSLLLDSPFVYGVIDMETRVPLFLGILRDPSED